jgi:hypothetical protein
MSTRKNAKHQPHHLMDVTKIGGGEQTYDDVSFTSLSVPYLDRKKQRTHFTRLHHHDDAAPVTIVALGTRLYAGIVVSVLCTFDTESHFQIAPIVLD